MIDVTASNTTDKTIQDIDQVLGPIAHAFWISLLILVLIYIFKYFANKECTKSDFIEILLEIPVDTLTLLLTVIITVFCCAGKMQYSHYLFIVTLIIAGICAMLRRGALSFYNKKDKGVQTFWCLFLEVIIGIGWIIVVYMIII